MRDAVNYAERAAASDPLSPIMRSDYIAALAYSGQIEDAIQELADAEKLWPGSYAMLDARSRIHARYGDPEEALRIQRAFRDPSRGFEYFILARKDPTPANIDRAIAQTKAELGRDSRATGFLIQAYGEFDRNESIFDALAAWQGTDFRQVLQPLFRPSLRKFRHDPRFMIVATRFGLVDYWRKSGKWPDFCFEPDLPYDCKAEAAKVMAGAR